MKHHCWGNHRVAACCQELWKLGTTKYFKTERRYGAGNSYKDLFLGRLQPGVNKNLTGLAVLMLDFQEFDDLMGQRHGTKNMGRRTTGNEFFVFCAIAPSDAWLILTRSKITPSVKGSMLGPPDVPNRRLALGKGGGGTSEFGLN